MSEISLKNGLISYYGNPAGYIEKEKAIVDSIFNNEELNNWLNNRKITPQWKDGIMERLIAGEQIYGTETPIPIKNIRVWQLKSEVDIRMKFIGLNETIKDFGEPSMKNYHSVYDGQLGTNDLEEIYAICNIDHPDGYKGHSMSMSDIIELYDDNGSEFHYCDTFGFKQISLNQDSQVVSQDMTQSL